MKTAGNIFQAVFLVFIFFLISGTACETKSTDPGKNPQDKPPSDSAPANDTMGYFWEVEADDTQKVINDTLQGIRFNFSLLDQDSVPSTVFQEGDNFVFSFLAENTRKDSLFFDIDFLYLVNHSYGEVLKIEGDNTISQGKPYKEVYARADLYPNYPFPPDCAYKIQIPWLYGFSLWNNYLTFSDYRFRIPGTSFLPSNPEPLNKGDYYTQFSWQYFFPKQGCDTAICTDSITFKINFKIQ